MINFENIVGHDNTFNELVRLHENNSLPNRILLTGQNGIGKSLLVNKFLKYVFKDDENRSSVENLIDNNSHPNIHKIIKKKNKKNIEIDDIRKMIHFQNHSSFNNKEKFVVIKDIENLNANSANALLKSIEEPNNNLFFLLINNSGYKIPSTIKSRCLEFKLFLNLDEVRLIVDNYFNQDIYNSICKDYVNHYNTPSFLIFLVEYFIESKKDVSSFGINEFISDIIKNKYYLTNDFIKENLKIIIEIFFYKNINVTKNISYKIKNYFYFKLSNIKRYNLDLETFFLEFEEKLLSE